MERREKESPQRLPDLLEDFDLNDASAVDALHDALSRPLAISATERMEAVVKEAWKPLIEARSISPEASLRFSEFFKEVGFLKKYKPYGVKLATPFGYSLFALTPRKGFSVQLHRAAKVEAFHILDVRPSGFVLLCDADEWHERGSCVIEELRGGPRCENELVFRPSRGDVFVVPEVGTVHTVIGCILEEFATTSNDVVERLFDQNASSATSLPDRHVSVEGLLDSFGHVRPRRRVWREGARWHAAAVDDGLASVVDLPDAGLRGGHVSLRGGSSMTLPPSDDAIVTVACLTGRVRVALSKGAFDLPCGGTLPVAPGEDCRLEAAMGDCHVAICSVATRLALADLRNGAAEAPRPPATEEQTAATKP